MDGSNEQHKSMTLVNSGESAHEERVEAENTFMP